MTSHSVCNEYDPPCVVRRTRAGRIVVRPSEGAAPPTITERSTEVHDIPFLGKWRLDPGERLMADGRPQRAVRSAVSTHLGRVRPFRLRDPKSSEPNTRLGPGMIEGRQTVPHMVRCLGLSEQEGEQRMRHEMRLTVFSDPQYGVMIQAYCLCGWISQHEFGPAGSVLSASYRLHIDEAQGVGGPF